MFSVYLWRYSPFQALASVIRRLHSSLFATLLLHPLVPSSCSASLWTTSAHLVLGLPAGLVNKKCFIIHYCLPTFRSLQRQSLKLYIYNNTYVFAFFCGTVMMASEANKMLWRIAMHEGIFYWCAFVGLLHNLKMSFRTTGTTPWTRPLLISRIKRKRTCIQHQSGWRTYIARQLTFWSMVNTFQIEVYETVRDNLGRQNVASVEGSWPACNPREGWLATRTVSSEAARQLAVLPPPLPC